MHNESRLQGFTAWDVRRLAFDLAEKLKLQHNFDIVQKLAGYDWFKDFLKRNPDLSLRKPEPTSSARAYGFNKDAVESFFNLLEKVCSQYGFSATNIYNMDETGVSCNPKTYLKVLAPKGKRKVGSRVSAERGTNVTAVICCSATGSYMPPTLIFPRKNENKSYLKDAPTGSKAAFNGIGWMDEQVFNQWLKDFIEFSNASLDNIVL